MDELKRSYVVVVRVHIVVEGMVQGVGFRWFVYRKAEALGITGWVRNLYNGSVEIEAEGDRSLLEEFIKEVKVGPRSARVTNLTIEWKDSKPPLYQRFDIL
jgi:acylphosphatase